MVPNWGRSNSQGVQNGAIFEAQMLQKLHAGLNGFHMMTSWWVWKLRKM